MKRMICMLLVLFISVSLAACGGGNTGKTDSSDVADAPVMPDQQQQQQEETTDEATEPSQPAASADSADGIDIDLTKLGSTMVYAEVSNMMMAPMSYENKTVRASGEFAVYQDEAKGKTYFACIIADATACCTQGLEFVLEGEHSYPEDYPEPGTTVTITGTFDCYEENGFTFCQLIDADMTVG